MTDHGKNSFSCMIKSIYHETIPINARAFDKFPVEIKAAIDRGSSLTKIVFVPKDVIPIDPETVHLHCFTFLNEHFIEAVQLLKNAAQLPKEGELHITGIGAATHREKIKEITGLDVVFVSEMVTGGYGPYFLISSCEPEHIFYPKPDYKIWAANSKMFQDAVEDTVKGISLSEEQFPALIMTTGSGSGVMKIDKDGKTSFVLSSTVSGKPFMGLAHVLCGTADYDQLMELALKGDCCKADLTMGDLFKDDPESPFKDFEPEMPAFPFGKASNKSWDRGACSREDLAASLLRLFAVQAGTMAFSAVTVSGINNIYMCGNFFRHELVRKLFFEQIAGFPILNINAHFLKTGHTGVIGAMLTNPKDIAKMVK